MFDSRREQLLASSVSRKKRRRVFIGTKDLPSRPTLEKTVEKQEEEKKAVRNLEFVQQDIKPIKTTKDDIEQPPLAAHENMYIPPLTSSVVVSGKSGSGKSTLMTNFMTSPHFYMGWFDETYLISPTAKGDDVQRQLGVKPENVITDLKVAPDRLTKILDDQQALLDANSSAANVKKIAVIFDDVIGDVQFLNSEAFTRCFYQVRHANVTSFICTQHFTRVPRICRLQANFLFFFEGSQSEVDILTEEFSPPMMHKRRFKQLVVDATKEDYSFLTINMKVPFRKRFRKKLYDIMPLEFYGLTDNVEDLERNVRHKVSQNDSEHGSAVNERQDVENGATVRGRRGKSTDGRDGNREKSSTHKTPTKTRGTIRKNTEEKLSTTASSRKKSKNYE